MRTVTVWEVDDMIEIKWRTKMLVLRILEQYMNDDATQILVCAQIDKSHGMKFRISTASREVLVHHG